MGKLISELQDQDGHSYLCCACSVALCLTHVNWYLNKDFSRRIKGKSEPGLFEGVAPDFSPSIYWICFRFLLSSRVLMLPQRLSVTSGTAPALQSAGMQLCYFMLVLLLVTSYWVTFKMQPEWPKLMSFPRVEQVSMYIHCACLNQPWYPVWSWNDHID